MTEYTNNNALMNVRGGSFRLADSDDLHRRGLDLIRQNKPSSRKLSFPKSAEESTVAVKIGRTASRTVALDYFRQSGDGYFHRIPPIMKSNEDGTPCIITNKDRLDIEIPYDSKCAIWLGPRISVEDICSIKGLRETDVLELSALPEDGEEWDEETGDYEYHHYAHGLLPNRLSDDMIESLNSLGCSFSILLGEVSKDLLLRLAKLSRIAYIEARKLPEDWLYEAFSVRNAPEVIHSEIEWTHDGALFSQLSGLRGLYSFGQTKESTCRNLSRLTDLQDLLLFTSDNGLDIITGSLPKLITLATGGLLLSDRGLRCLTRLSRTLEELWLDNAHQLAGPGLSVLSECISLSKLVLADSGITDETISHLGALPRLIDLELINLKQLAGLGLEQLWKAPNLRYLYLSGGIKTSAFNYLPMMEHLEVIEGHVTMTAVDLIPLCRLPRLKSLAWFPVKMDPESFNRKRKELGFQSNPLTEEIRFRPTSSPWHHRHRTLSIECATRDAEQPYVLMPFEYYQRTPKTEWTGDEKYLFNYIE